MNKPAESNSSRSRWGEKLRDLLGNFLQFVGSGKFHPAAYLEGDLAEVAGFLWAYIGGMVLTQLVSTTVFHWFMPWKVLVLWPLVWTLWLYNIIVGAPL
jgi:hypothetical protein